MTGKDSETSAIDPGEITMSEHDDNSDTSSTPPPPAPGAASETTAQLGGRPRARTIAFIVAAAVLIVLLGGGALVWRLLSGGGPQPQDVMPSSMTAMVRVDANPSASQKVNLFKLVKKVPQVADLTGITDEDQDIRELALGPLLESCDMTWDADVEPWIGKRFGIGFDNGLDKPLIAIQVADEDKAKDKLDDVLECAGMTPNGTAFSKGYAVIGPDQDFVDEAIADANDETLAENAGFADDMSQLGDQGIASIWAQPSTIADDFVGSNADPLDEMGSRSVAVALRATSSTLEVAGVGEAGGGIDDGPGAQLGKLPAETVGALGISSGVGAIEDNWDEFLNMSRSLDLDLTSQLRTLEASTGLSLPEDMDAVFGDQFRLAIGERLAEAAVTDDFEPENVDVLMTAQGTQTQRVAETLSDAMKRETGYELPVTSIDDTTVLSFNESFADKLRSGDTLADSDAFNAVISDPSDTVNGLFFDAARIVDISGDQFDAAMLPWLEPVQAIGISQTQDGDYAEMVMRIGFRD